MFNSTFNNDPSYRNYYIAKVCNLWGYKINNLRTLSNERKVNTGSRNFNFQKIGIKLMKALLSNGLRKEILRKTTLDLYTKTTISRPHFDSSSPRHKQAVPVHRL